MAYQRPLRQSSSTIAHNFAATGKMGATFETVKKLRIAFGVIVTFILMFFITRKTSTKGMVEVISHSARSLRLPEMATSATDRSFVTHSGDKGWLFEAQPPNHPNGSTHVISLPPGSVRGNHFHRLMHETIIVFGGRTRLVTQKVNADGSANGERKEYIIDQTSNVDGSQLRRFYLGPSVAHALQNMESPGGATSYAVCTNDVSRSSGSNDKYTNDVYVKLDTPLIVK
jgi:dTDP-4-dehydrorhamnose 3,5-epimerase-like enzyme